MAAPGAASGFPIWKTLLRGFYLSILINFEEGGHLSGWLKICSAAAAFGG
jgi:hypothetical protein